MSGYRCSIAINPRASHCERSSRFAFGQLRAWGLSSSMRGRATADRTLHGGDDEDKAGRRICCSRRDGDRVDGWLSAGSCIASRWELGHSRSGAGNLQLPAISLREGRGRKTLSGVSWIAAERSCGACPQPARKPGRAARSMIRPTATHIDCRRRFSLTARSMRESIRAPHFSAKQKFFGRCRHGRWMGGVADPCEIGTLFARKMARLGYIIRNHKKGRLLSCR
jgi:hypothetical protein